MKYDTEEHEVPLGVALEADNMTSVDWKEVLPRYRGAYKEWTITPTWLWLLIGAIGILAVIYAPAPWGDAGCSLIAGSFFILGSRSTSADERFQIGYEWGLEDGVYRGMGIPKDQQADAAKRAHEWRVEYRLNTGDEYQPNKKEVKS